MEAVLFNLALFVVALTDGVRKTREAREERMREFRRLGEAIDVEAIVKERMLRQQIEQEWAFLDEHIARTPFGRAYRGAPGHRGG